MKTYNLKPAENVYCVFKMAGCPPTSTLSAVTATSFKSPAMRVLGSCNKRPSPSYPQGRGVKKTECLVTVTFESLNLVTDW